MSLLEREKTKTTGKKEIASFLLLTGPTLFSIGPTFSAWVDNKEHFMPHHHSYNVQCVVGSQFLDTPKLELGSAIDWVWDLGNLLHLPVFSSVKWGYDGIDLKGLGGFNDIKDIALFLGYRQNSVLFSGGLVALPPQCEVKGECHCTHYYLPCSS